MRTKDNSQLNVWYSVRATKLTKIKVSISSNDFYNNSGKFGGAFLIRIEDKFSKKSTNLLRNKFFNNSAEYGGAIFIDS